MEVVSDRLLTIGTTTFRAGIPFTVEDWRGAQLLEAGTVRHACPPQVLYESQSPEQNAKRLREQGVTCLCLTRNRREWLPKAIKSYLAQSYPNRELLILADGEEVRDLIPERADIRLVHIEEGRNIGDKRNYGVSLARGRYVAHWDDDDYSAPDRLLDQVTRLRNGSLAVTGYTQLDFTDGNSWWRHMGDVGHAPGSTLLYERGWAIQHPFVAVQIGEDGDFVKDARERKAIVTAPANGMMTATIHAGNTSPRPTHLPIWNTLERSAAGLAVIIPSKTTSNFMQCAEAVRVCEPQVRIIGIDDGLDVEAMNLPREDLMPTWITRGEKPFIFARNVNIGIRAAGRDDVVILNDDAILKTPGGFSLLQKAATEHPEFGLMAATTNVVGNRNQQPHGIGLREDPRMACFVAVFIPRTTLDAIGYLDERFTAYGHEDDDYCYRVRRAGLKIGIHDGCFVDHASLKSTFRTTQGWQMGLNEGRRIFIEKWGSYPL
jgi:hypothetical protein